MDLISGKKLKNVDGRDYPADEVLRHKTRILFYFSASWCSDCNAFTSKMTEFYQENKVNGVEVCLVSWDFSAEQMYRNMRAHRLGFLAVEPMSELANSLIRRFDVRSLPTVVVCSEDGRVLSKDGRRDIELFGNTALARWN